MDESQSKRTNRIVTALSASALAPALRSLLVFDAQPQELRRIARTAAEILRLVNQRPIVTRTLGSNETDDDLWGNFRLQKPGQDSPLFWQSGLLFDSQSADSNRVILIPDLAQLSLIAARACIMLMGESLASLERHGRRFLWQPEIFWVAGCATPNVGKVSAHLLDRFALRLNIKSILDHSERIAHIQRMLASEESREEYATLPLPTNLGEMLRAAAEIRPRMTDEAIAQVFNYVAPAGFYSPRRDLTLARLALVNAQLDNKTEVVKRHVDQAAQVIGLKPLSYEAEASRETSEPEELTSEQQNASSISENPEDASPSKQPTNPPPVPRSIQDLAREVDVPPEVFPASALPPGLAVSPYPEDEAPVEHEDAPLRLPSRISRRDEIGNGPVIGTERATSLQDLALVRTLLEAAKFQPIRRKHTLSLEDKFLISPADLYSYRREPTPEQMLVLLIDYTSLKGAAWEDALLPFLKEAYIGRAMICLIKVGAADAYHELKAERIEARSILVPGIAEAFLAMPGRASPLAHGMDLALQSLRRSLQHGRGSPRQATLVILSDGRGNVPLEDSRRGEVVPPVMRRGFEDALQLAWQIRKLDYIRVIFLNTQPHQHIQLPMEIAEALGAEVREISPQTTNGV